MIPAYDEELTIGSVVAYGDALVVDNSSLERAPEIAQKAGTTVIHHTVNRGRGTALKSGFEYVLSPGYDVVVTKFNLLILPSYMESLPNIIMDSMAYGVLILSTPVGGVLDGVIDKKTSFILWNYSLPYIAKKVMKISITQLNLVGS